MKRVRQGPDPSQTSDGSRLGFGSAFGGSQAFGGATVGSSLSYLAELPSFNAVSDPNVVVKLKNVLKKDGTTKSKALEDLLHYVQAHPFEEGGGVDESLLEIWAQLYPRISIDNSRRVRELSHNLQFELMKSARKRMEKHIPKIVGAWLSGLYDRDRIVARAANDGLASFLDTPVKFSAFWTKCRPHILDYAIQAVQESQDTLSDERSTSVEDAETKYFRVVAASLSLVLRLLQLDNVGVETSRQKLDAFFDQGVVWESITFKDPQVRQTVCQLLFACLERQLPYAETAKAREAFVTGGLKTNQSGSALEYVRALTKLTQCNPNIWVANSSDDKSSFITLQAFIAKGSQGSPSKFWECLDQLLTLLPTGIWTLETASSLLNSLKSGITNRDEHRNNTSCSWNCYVNAAKRCLNALSDDDRLALAKELFLPLLKQFLFSASEEPLPNPLGTNAMWILVEMHFGLIKTSTRLAQALADEWARLGAVLCAKISTSLPDVSKEYQTSQIEISEEARRWFGLVGLVHSRLQEIDNALLDQTAGPSCQVVMQCIMLLESRNMKPIGVAQALEYALSSSPHLFTADTAQRLVGFLLSAAEEDMEKVVRSASSRNLFSCLRILGTIPGRQGDYENIWKLWAQSAMNLSSPVLRTTALMLLVSQEKAAPIARRLPEIQEAIYFQARETVESNEEGTDWIARDLLESAVAYQVLDPETCRRIASDMVSLLARKTPHTERILEILEIVARRRPELFSQQGSIHTDLVTELLSLSEVGNDKISLAAARIRSLLDGNGSGTLPVVDIIRSNLEQAGPQSLEISTLAAQAKSAADAHVPWEDMLPSTNVWMAELSTLLERPIDPSLSITTDIGGAVTLPETVPVSRIGQTHMSRDRQGRSIPARMALYTYEILCAAPEIMHLSRQLHVELLYLQCVSMQVASDQITSLGVDGLWMSLEDDDAMRQAEELITSSRLLLTKLIAVAAGWDDGAVGRGKTSNVIRGLIDLAIKEATELNSRGVYSARALSELLRSLTEVHGAPSKLEETFLRPEVLKVKQDTALVTAGLIAGFGDRLQSSKAANNFCNRLVSEIASISPKCSEAKMTLVIFTLCAQIYDPGDLPVANNRIVFAAKQVISWTESIDDLEADLCAEICRALGRLLPCMKEVYGPYWEKTLQFCASLWDRACQHSLSKALPFIHSSLKLVKFLEDIQEPNEDLQDALKEFASTKCNRLVELMKLPRGESSQLVEIVDAMLWREVQKIPVVHIPEPPNLFPLIASGSRNLQTATFTMLHKKIPAHQEQKSIDVILEKTDAYLSDELLSLLLDPPTLDNFSDEALAHFPSTIRCYLLSWKLLYDTFSASPLKMRRDFTEHLKRDEFVGPLLDFMFDVLGHSAAHPLNLDKENLGPQQICDYDIGLADAEKGEKSMHWLLAHLYYLTLKYAPGLFKAWYIGCRSKQTRTAVDSWTAKYFSPLIIADTLDEVQAWADSQEPPASDEQKLLVRVSKKAREVTAGYEVDESQASIVIKLAPNYPIEGVSVAGLHRVAVTERKWQSWIMTTQGVISFSNGSIIDGLQIFKRNILGALKGQSECAICYSIISTDKRMPDKRCTTCKNFFHRTCLYKWFQSSNQNTCPLCRNPIDYLGADTTKRRQA